MRSLSRRVPAAAALGLLALMQACDTTDHSGEPALLTVAADAGATRYSKLLVILRDSAGDDTLWDDSLENPSQLQRLPTKRYRGGPVMVVLEGFTGGEKVFAETRAFDPAARTTPRDTLTDLSAAINRFAFDTSKALLPFGGSLPLRLAILPPKADGRVILTVSDSEVVALTDSGRGADGIRRYKLTARKSGSVRIIAASRSRSGLADTVDVQVSHGTSSLLAPINRSPVWSNSPRPTWTWSHGGPGGIGFYAVRIDNDVLREDHLVDDTAYTAPDSLADGPHTLYVWERDQAGDFSPSTGMVIRIDTRPPEAPKVSPAAFEATDSPHPAWSWVPQGGGNGHYRVRIDAADPGSGAVLADSARYRAPDSLGLGAHVLYVQESDSAGNWSASGNAAVTVVAADKTPPNAPVRRGGLGAPVWHDTLAWKSGGGGAGVYRYLIDDSDFAKRQPTEIRDSALVPPDSLDTALALHYLYVEERDAVGNWSAAGRFPFNVAHFTFIRSLDDSGFVLTLGTADELNAQSASVGISRMIVTPKDTAERSLQKRQLWQFSRDTSNADAYRIDNPFYHLRLEAVGEGKPIKADTLAFSVAGILPQIFTVKTLPFVGGTPPPWYRISPLDGSTAVTLDPGTGPLTDGTGQTLQAATLSDHRQLWLIQPWREKWWLE